MRVAMIDPSLFTLPYDRALAEALEAAGHHVTLHGRRPRHTDGSAAGVTLAVDFYRFSEGPLARGLPAPLRLGLKGVDHIFSLRRLLRRLRAQVPDVIHWQWMPLPLVDKRVLPRLRRIAPLVVTVHDTDPFNGSPAAAVQVRRYFSALRCFDRLIVHTEQGRARLQAHGIPPERIVRVAAGAERRDASVDRGGDPESPVEFLMFGKIKRYKGVDLLIEAFAAMPPILQQRARMRVVGMSYIDLAPLRSLAERLGVGRQLSIEEGFVADEAVGALFGAQTVAVFPYREIEASAVLGQALGFGRPVVGTRLGSFAETITDGVHGHVVAPGDTASLARALAHMVEDRGFRETCAAHVREMAGRLPQWDEVADCTASVYRDAAAYRTREMARGGIARSVAGEEADVAQPRRTGRRSRYAVIFRTHFWDEFAQRQFDRLRAQVRDGDIYVLADETHHPVSGIRHDKVLRITAPEVLAMGFVAAGEGNLLWFNGDYPLYLFQEKCGPYDYYVQLEYDAVFNSSIDALVERIAADRIDFVGLTKGEPTPAWPWVDTCKDAYDPADIVHQLICVSVFSDRALHHLRMRRLALSDAYRAGAIRAWPMCEGFIATEMALGGFRCAELSAYGGTESYDHWPPILERDLGRAAGDFIHPILDQDRYIGSLLKYKVGLGGYLHPNSLFHRKLRRLPARIYLRVLVTSFMQKARRTVRTGLELRSRSRAGASA